MLPVDLLISVTLNLKADSKRSPAASDHSLNSFYCFSQAAVHTDRVRPDNEKSNGGENGPVHTDTAAAEPQVSDEEDKERKREEEDKEELEFPHDLLPSIDLSTELNLTWGTSLG